MKFMAPKKARQLIFFLPLFDVVGSGIRDPLSSIRNPGPGWEKIRIRDKNPGSTTLELHNKHMETVIG
jgi:hypothetical protein